MSRAVTNPAVQHTLRTQVLYHFPAASSVSFTPEQVVVESAATDLSEEAVSALVNEVADTFAVLPAVPTRVYYDSGDPPQGRVARHDQAAFDAAARQLAAELDEARSLPPRRALAARRSPAGRGLNLYGHEIAALSRGIDQFIRRFYQYAYRAQELRVPSMLPTAVIDRAGYFDTARQHLSFVSPLNPAPETFAGFLPYWKEHGGNGTRRDDGLRDFLSTPGEVLNPAMCLHCYPLVADTEIPVGEPAVFTLAGACFRDESGNLNHDNRLREFLMREAVFVGDEHALEQAHGEMVDFVVAMATLFGLDFRMESANDIFFNDGAPQRLFSQLVSDNKIELMVRGLPDGAPMAAASVNRHQAHFTIPFGTASGGRPALSICGGFGVDRLVLALVQRAAEQETDLLAMLSESVTDHLTVRAAPA
ncbi:hypothetical protein AB0C15_10660 [Micromonospora sp. NPDC048835]|uniref:hypothetical protein n=1 Tax=Micromonospora sp. NPDC048835 TaxID=3155147 RepID=UPI0033E36F92